MIVEHNAGDEPDEDGIEIAKLTNEIAEILNGCHVAVTMSVLLTMVARLVEQAPPPIQEQMLHDILGGVDIMADSITAQQDAIKH